MSEFAKVPPELVAVLLKRWMTDPGSPEYITEEDIIAMKRPAPTLSKIGEKHKPVEHKAEPVVSKKPEAPEPKSDAPTKQFGLDDVYAVLDGKYAAFPDYKAANAITRASSEDVEIKLPDHRSVTVNRKKIRECFNVEQLRSYIETSIK